jgi:hypothetical protein
MLLLFINVLSNFYQIKVIDERKRLAVRGKGKDKKKM